VRVCLDVFRRLGVDLSTVVLGTLNAGHPGGTLPLRGHETSTFDPSGLPDNLSVADATLLPQALGNPPSFTIMAMAKRVGCMCAALA